MRITRLSVLVALVAFCLVASMVPGQAYAREKAKSGNDKKVDVIVQFERGAARQEIDSTKEFGDLKQQYKHLSMLAMTVAESRLEPLRDNPNVKSVTLDKKVVGFSESARQTARVPQIGSPYDMTYHGNGYSIAVIDSGVGAHPDVPVLMQQDFVTGSKFNYPYDPFGHGTHIAGIAAGEGSASYYVHWGNAFRSRIISLRVLDKTGAGDVSAVLSALDWLLDNGAQNNVRVVNLSLGTSVDVEAALDPLVQAVEQVWDAGMVVVVSAGNYGRAGAGTITSPGISRKVITVGSITDNGTGNDFDDDYVSTYSSTGPTRFDHYLKPDLLAPGNRFVAAMAAEAAMLVTMPERIATCGATTCNADYLELSGTSMAAGLVSGTAVRMIGRDPSLTPDTVKARLMQSARKIAGDPTVVGAGVLDIRAAIDATGTATQALSPTLIPVGDGTGVYIEDTAGLWSDAASGTTWDVASIWSDAGLWSDASIFSDAFVFSDAGLWSDASIFSDAFVFSDASVWSDRVTQDDGVFQAGAQSLEILDDAGTAAFADPSTDR